MLGQVLAQSILAAPEIDGGYLLVCLGEILLPPDGTCVWLLAFGAYTPACFDCVELSSTARPESLLNEREVRRRANVGSITHAAPVGAVGDIA